MIFNEIFYHSQISIPQNLIRMQVQNQPNSQPILISAASLQNQLQNQPQILQMAQHAPTGVGQWNQVLNQNISDE